MTDAEVQNACDQGLPIAVPILFDRRGPRRVICHVIRACHPSRDMGRGRRHDGTETWMIRLVNADKPREYIDGFDRKGVYYGPAADFRPATAAELLVLEDA